MSSLRLKRPSFDFQWFFQDLKTDLEQQRSSRNIEVKATEIYEGSFLFENFFLLIFINKDRNSEGMERQKERDRDTCSSALLFVKLSPLQMGTRVLNQDLFVLQCMCLTRCAASWPHGQVIFILSTLELGVTYMLVIIQCVIFLVCQVGHWNTKMCMFLRFACLMRPAD